MPEQGALLEFLRGTVVEPSANTFTEAEISTPASRSEKLAMLVWYIEMDIEVPTIEDAQNNSVQGQLTSTSQTAMIRLDNPDLIWGNLKRRQAGTVQGSLTEYYSEPVFKPTFVQFAPPFLYAKAEMFLQVLSTGEPSVHRVSVKVGYTLERVPAELFIAALVE